MTRRAYTADMLDEMALRPVKTVGNLIDIVAARFDASDDAKLAPEIPTQTPFPKGASTGIRP